MIKRKPSISIGFFFRHYITRRGVGAKRFWSCFFHFFIFPVFCLWSCWWLWQEKGQNCIIKLWDLFSFNKITKWRNKFTLSKKYFVLFFTFICFFLLHSNGSLVGFLMTLSSIHGIEVMSLIVFIFGNEGFFHGASQLF